MVLVGSSAPISGALNMASHKDGISGTSLVFHFLFSLTLKCFLPPLARLPFLSFSFSCYPTSNSVSKLSAISSSVMTYCLSFYLSLCLFVSFSIHCLTLLKSLLPSSPFLYPLLLSFWRGYWSHFSGNNRQWQRVIRGCGMASLCRTIQVCISSKQFSIIDMLGLDLTWKLPTQTLNQLRTN